MYFGSQPRWQQVTALVSLSAGGAIAGLSFVPRTAADLASPTAVPIHLLALQHSARPAPADDQLLRSAIVNVANYYLRMARGQTPAEMAAIIWQNDSINGVDHGESCAAFASLTLELAAQAVGQQSWVTGGTSYPWPLHKWADARVEQNPASPGVVSIRQDAAAHDRWHPLSDGYQPQPGDWVLFHNHVEIVTKYAHGVLHTVGGDSLPNFSVNAHEYREPLDYQGVVGFVNNGTVSGTASQQPPGREHSSGGHRVSGGHRGSAGHRAQEVADTGLAAIPGAPAVGSAEPAPARRPGQAAMPGPAAGPGQDGRPEPRPSRPGHEPAAKAPHGPGHPGSGRSVSGHGVSGHGASGHHGSGHRGSGHRGAGRAGKGTKPGHGPAGAAATAQADAVGAAAIPGPPAAAPSPPPDSTGPSPGSHARHHPGPAVTAPAGAGPAPVTTPAPAGTSPAATPAPATTPAPAPATTPAPTTTPPGPVTTPAPAATPSPSVAPPQDMTAQQAFIDEVAPGAVAAQRQYGVPAAVTIAQAIDESGWGQSSLAIRDHNLFGIKGAGPAGSDLLPTQEYEGGQPVTRMASFRAYDNFAQSIEDHGKLLATSGYYGQAMAERQDPNAFATALTGVYATDPDYGPKLIGLMRTYDLYRYDAATPAVSPGTAAPHDATVPGPPAPAPSPAASKLPPATTTPDDATIPGPPPAAPSPAAPSPAASTVPPATATTPPDSATIPGPALAAASPAPSKVPAAAATVTPAPGGQSDPDQPAPSAMPSTQSVSATRLPARGAVQPRKTAARPARSAAGRYQQHIPQSVTDAFITIARAPLIRAEPLYRDVASDSGIRWELLAACDWMQCKAQPRYSPVHGEKLGTVNPDGTIYRTKSAALEQCTDDLVELAREVYQIDLTGPGDLSVRDLANVFAAFRWGGLLKLHHTSAMEFPYSVAGLTTQHLHMRWPDIADPNTPDKPGTRFRSPFGAVPVVLGLKYPAIV
jgi:flagellum-specific peptidoglycan hydrolase FlgJ